MEHIRNEFITDSAEIIFVSASYLTDTVTVMDIKWMSKFKIKSVFERIHIQNEYSTYTDFVTDMK
jgi:hypothetical protein